MDSAALAQELGLAPERVWFASPDQTARERASSSIALAKAGPLVIAVDGQYSGVRSSSYPGVEVLMWLRLKHKTTKPILMVGFQRVEEILAKHPEHLILCAPGNRYMRLAISNAEFAGAKKWLHSSVELSEAAMPGKYKNYLAPAFDSAGFKHKAANVFGLKMLWDRIPAIECKGYPESLQTELDTDLTIHLAEVLRHTGSKPPAKTDKPEAPGDFADLRVVHIDDHASLGWSDLIQGLLYGGPVGKDKFDSVDVLRVSEGRLSMENRIKPLTDLVFASVRHTKPHALLLDLRLFPDLDDALGNDVGSMSGALLLKAIRQQYWTLPVIVTTASNKVWSYETMMSVGADAYVMKRAVEGESDGQAMFESWDRLGFLLSASRQAPYQVLFRMEAVRKRLEVDPTPLWWEIGNWPDGAKRKAKRTAVMPMLETITEMLRLHCQRFVFSTVVDEHQQRSSIAGLCVAAGIIYENMVDVEGSPPPKVKRALATMVQQNRTGKPAWRKIMEKARHIASHAGDYHKLKPETLISQFNTLMDLVVEEPQLNTEARPEAE